jgi:ATP-binding cassette, subfamily B, bacterial MsbA
LPSAMLEYASGLSEATRLAVIAATMVALIALKSAIVYAHFAPSAWLSGRVARDLRRDLFRQVVDVGYVFLARRGHGRIYNTIDSETWRTSDALDVLSQLVASACAVAVFIVLLLLISVPMTLAVAVGAVLVSLLMRRLRRLASEYGEIAVTANAGLSERILEALNNMRVIRAFGREGAELARFEGTAERVRRTFFRLELVQGMVPPATELLYVPLLLGIVFFAWQTGIGLPSLLAFLLMCYRLQPHIRNLDHKRVELAGASGAVMEVAALLREDDKPRVVSGGVPFRGLRDAVRFVDVGFRYDGEENGARPVLSGVSLEIRRGSVTAIVGASGAGKSTIINLLYRLFDPDEGEILVDGRPLRELDLAAWRRRLAIAGQDAELVTGTIRDNIAYGRPEADDAMIRAAARAADADGFIRALAAGYDTPIGPRGITLSGGQRQRIALARALLREPEILILDEATNALDSVSEYAIQKALEALAGRTTLVIIAHRLSTVRGAHHLVVLGEGRVLEQGPPRDLLEAEGVFTSLYALQTDGAA